MNNHKSFLFSLAVLMPLISAARADVGDPPKPPPVPAGYCSTIYNEVLPDLQAFNLVLKVPPTWTAGVGWADEVRGESADCGRQRRPANLQRHVSERRL
jgi:hypothetical protein